MIIFGHPVTKRKVLEWILALVATAGVGFLLAFIIINLLLGCETWDESLWTEYNSCFTPQQFIEGVTNDKGYVETLHATTASRWSTSKR